MRISRDEPPIGWVGHDVSSPTAAFRPGRVLGVAGGSDLAGGRRPARGVQRRPRACLAGSPERACRKTRPARWPCSSAAWEWCRFCSRLRRLSRGPNSSGRHAFSAGHCRAVLRRRVDAGAFRTAFRHPADAADRGHDRVACGSCGGQPRHRVSVVRRRRHGEQTVTEPRSTEPLFREVGASWYWLLAGPAAAIVMLGIEINSGVGSPIAGAGNLSGDGVGFPGGAGEGGAHAHVGGADPRQAAPGYRDHRRRRHRARLPGTRPRSREVAVMPARWGS